MSWVSWSRSAEENLGSESGGQRKTVLGRIGEPRRGEEPRRVKSEVEVKAKAELGKSGRAKVQK